MDNGIRICISSRMEMFEKYYTVPADAESAVRAFATELEDLGKSASDVTDFEAKFASGGYQERFTELLMGCTPKPYQMTREEQETMDKTTRELLREDSGEAVVDTADTAPDDLQCLRRRAMVEAGVLDEYTQATNMVEDATILGKAVGKWFKKKK